MAKQKAPDGTEYEYDERDPADVMRVALLCEPSEEEKRKRAKAAFQKAAPEAARLAQTGVALGAGGASQSEIQEMIKQAIAAAVAEMRQPSAPAAAPAAAPLFGAGHQTTLVDPGAATLGAAAPVEGSQEPVDGSQGI